MARYHVVVLETIRNEYEVTLPDGLDDFEAEEYFYDLDEEDQKKGLLLSQSTKWEIHEIEEV